MPPLGLPPCATLRGRGVLLARVALLPRFGAAMTWRCMGAPYGLGRGMAQDPIADGPWHTLEARLAASVPGGCGHLLFRMQVWRSSGHEL